MPEFVIQKHTHTNNPAHWDLMLRQGDTLVTWRISVPPEQMSVVPIEAEKISDHPLKFLTYQGTVNNGKGNVEIADTGTYELIERTPDKIKISIAGRIINGVMELMLIENSLWQLKYQPFVQR
jgi:hypothetical protein